MVTGSQSGKEPCHDHIDELSVICRGPLCGNLALFYVSPSR
jgi:hypothetical protein